MGIEIKAYKAADGRIFETKRELEQYEIRAELHSYAVSKFGDGRNQADPALADVVCSLMLDQSCPFTLERKPRGPAAED